VAAPTTADVIRAALTAGHARLAKALEDVRTGRPDAVHQVRVAARTLRSQARLFRSFVGDDWLAAVRDELAWLAGECGRARDLEVVAAWLDDLADDPERPYDRTGRMRLAAKIRRRRRTADARATRAVQSERARTILALIASGETRLNPGAEAPARESLTPRVADAWRKYATAARRVSRNPGAADADWHRVRVLAKRARYAAAVSSDVIAAGEVESASKYAQAVLGRHQDCVVAADVITGLAASATDPAEAFTAGRLVEAARRARLDVRREFRRPKKTPPGLS
jgi:CHAD domain-containing protein